MVEALTFQLPWRDALAGAALLLRAVGFAAVAPVIGAEGVPIQTRGGLALLLVVLLAPVVPPPPAGVDMIWLVGSELFIGLTLGFIGRLALEVLLFAGTVVGHSTGMALAAMLDPLSQTQVTGLGLFYQIVGTLIFFGLGGHHAVLAALVKSYTMVPPGAANLTGPWLPAAVAMTGQVLSSGLRLAAPLLVIGLLVDLVLLLLARAAPQLNVLIVGAPIRMAAGLTALALSLHVFAPVLGHAIESATQLAARFLAGLARGG